MCASMKSLIVGARRLGRLSVQLRCVTEALSGRPFQVLVGETDNRLAIRGQSDKWACQFSLGLSVNEVAIGAESREIGSKRTIQSDNGGLLPWSVDGTSERGLTMS